MRATIALLTLFALASAAPAWGGASSERKVLVVGEEQRMDLSFTPCDPRLCISVGNPSVVLPQLVKLGTKSQLVFKPLKAGHTTVVVRDKTGMVQLDLKVDAVEADPELLRSRLDQILVHDPDITAKVVGGQVVLDGQAANPDEYGRIAQLLTQRPYAGSVISLVTLSPKYFEELARKITAELSSFAPKAHARAVGREIWLEGTVSGAGAAMRAQKVAELLLPAALPPEPIENVPGAQVLQGRKMLQNFLVVTP